MLGNPSDFIQHAAHHRTAVPAFNIDSLEMAKGVVEAAESMRRNVILQVTVETLDIWGWDVFSQSLLTLLKSCGAGVGLVLDHAKAPDSIERALQLGFPGVMYDGSARPVDYNIRVTRDVVQLARAYHAYVEGEVGHVARKGEPPEWEHLTSVAEAQEYWNATGVDALAVAVGNRHGEYRSVKDVHVDRLDEIAKTTQCPLVLHGGSGIPSELLDCMKSAGIRKVNIGTEFRRVWWHAITSSSHLKPREALDGAKNAIKGRAESLIAAIAGP